MKHLLSIADLDGESIHSLLMEAAAFKKGGWLNKYDHKILALVFEKPSLRTRVSFEVGMRQLGGSSIYLSPAEVGLGKRESVRTQTRVLGRFCKRDFRRVLLLMKH